MKLHRCLVGRSTARREFKACVAAAIKHRRNHEQQLRQGRVREGAPAPREWIPGLQGETQLKCKLRRRELREPTEQPAVAYSTTHQRVSSGKTNWRPPSRLPSKPTKPSKHLQALLYQGLRDHGDLETRSLGHRPKTPSKRSTQLRHQSQLSILTSRACKSKNKTPRQGRRCTDHRPSPCNDDAGSMPFETPGRTASGALS